MVLTDANGFAFNSLNTHNVRPNCEVEVNADVRSVLVCVCVVGQAGNGYSARPLTSNACAYLKIDKGCAHIIRAHKQHQNGKASARNALKQILCNIDIINGTEHVPFFCATRILSLCPSYSFFCYFSENCNIYFDKYSRNIYSCWINSSDLYYFFSGTVVLQHRLWVSPIGWWSFFHFLSLRMHNNGNGFFCSFFALKLTKNKHSWYLFLSTMQCKQKLKV